MNNSAEPAVVDTNVLIYAFLPAAKQHPASRRLLEQARQNRLKLAVTPQILLEFYAVATNPRQMELPRSPGEVLETIERLLLLPGLSLLPAHDETLFQWMRLIRRHPVAGTRAFDLQIIAAMLSYDLRTIYTYDSHFRSFPEIRSLTPPDRR